MAHRIWCSRTYTEFITTSTFVLLSTRMHEMQREHETFLASAGFKIPKLHGSGLRLTRQINTSMESHCVYMYGRAFIGMFNSYHRHG